MSALAAALARGLLLALACGSIAALRILERGEAFSPRTTLVIALFAAGGLLGGAAGALLLRRLRVTRPLPRTALAAVGGTALVLAATFGVFALYRNLDLLRGTLEQEGLVGFLVHGLLGLTIDAAGAFAVTARPYLLPWPLLATALAAALVLARTPRAPLRKPEARVT
ncbi:hypothetical protein [Salinarimonas sp.]|uniref:hypothetical protein n=1 Tax=Salinarimonas sp. TaxID=2766526 RepID=UPI0032D94902